MERFLPEQKRCDGTSLSLSWAELSLSLNIHSHFFTILSNYSLSPSLFLCLLSSMSVNPNTWFNHTFLLLQLQHSCPPLLSLLLSSPKKRDFWLDVIIIIIIIAPFCSFRHFSFWAAPVFLVGLWWHLHLGLVQEIWVVIAIFFKYFFWWHA